MDGGASHRVVDIRIMRVYIGGKAVWKVRRELMDKLIFSEPARSFLPPTRFLVRFLVVRKTACKTP
jgi:hypothetical protein